MAKNTEPLPCPCCGGEAKLKTFTSRGWLYKVAALRCRIALRRSARNIWEDIMKLIKIALALSLIAVCLVGCDMGTSQSSPDTSNDNYTDSIYYHRRVTVYNTRTDTVIFCAEGHMRISNSKNIYITIRTGDREQKRIKIALNEWTVPVVEELDCEHDDPYYHKIYYHEGGD